MDNLQLLIVEDEEKQRKMYSDQINFYNKSSEIKIDFSLIDDLNSGLEEINKKFFDAAIIDLKLSKSEDMPEGNIIIKQIQENKRFPVIVISGFIEDLDDRIIENALLKKYDRANCDIQNILKDIVSVYNTGITKILGGKGEIEKYLNEIFWKHISGNFESYYDIEDSEKVLLRQISYHLSEYLDNTPEKYNSFEMYIIPPIKSEICTGDILQKSDQFYIVLNPSCDLVIRSYENNIPKRNSDRLLISKINRLKDLNEFSSFVFDTSLGKDKKEIIKKYISNSKRERYHFLPSNKIFSDMIIDFQSLENISFEEVKTYERIAAITGPFIKDIVARFSQYYSRQGQPDFDVDRILNSILR